MLTRQKIKLLESTKTDKNILQQTSGQVTTNLLHRRKTAISKAGRPERKYKPYHRPVVKHKKNCCKNLTKDNEEQRPKPKQSQQTITKPKKKDKVKNKTSDDKLTVLKTIDTTVVYDTDSGTWGLRLAVASDKMAWSSTPYTGIITLFNRRERIMKKLKLDLKPVDISVNCNGDLIFSEFKGRYIWKLTDNKEQIIADLYPYMASGLCWTSDNEILVCLKKTIFVHKVVRISLEGKILQTIQKDKNHKYIFSGPVLIAENVNKDICVVDDYDNLVVLDKDGEVKFKFLQTRDDTNRIFRGFYGIACDSLGCILLSDPDSNCIHMISGVGQYLQKVPTVPFGVQRPWGLGTDNKNQLWIVDTKDFKLKIIKYRS